MAPKRAKPAKVGLTDFLGDAGKVEFLPSKSDGLDFAKGAGKGGGGFGGGFGDRDGGFGGKGKGKEQERSRADDDGDWKSGGRSGGGGFGGGGGGGMKGRNDGPTRGDGDDQWRGGGRDFGGGGKGGGGGGFGGGGKGRVDQNDDRDWGRGGGGGKGGRDEGPSMRKPLALTRRSVDGPVGGPAGGIDSIRSQMGSGGQDKPSGKMTGYVPPALRKQQQEREARERQENEDRSRRTRDEDRRRRQEEDEEQKEAREEAERQKVVDAKKAKELDIKKAKKKAKDEEKRKAREAQGLKYNADDEPSEEELRLREFEERVQAAIDGKGDTKKLAKEVTTILEQEDLQSDTAVPAKHLFRPLLTACRGQDDNFVINLVQRFVPVVERLLIEGEDVWRYKVKFLAQVATAAAEMRLPRLSPKSALLEVIFDGLYQSELFEEQYFQFWSVWDDDRNPSKTMAVFQVQPFLEFLVNGRIEGEEYDDGVDFKVMQGTFAYGDDIEEAVMTLEQAKRRACELGDMCQGFVFEGQPSEEDMFEVVFMSKEGWELTTEESEEYTTVMKVADENEEESESEDDD